MRTSTNLHNRFFILDPSSIDRIDGRQIDWNLIPTSYDESAFTVQLNGAVLANAGSLTVDALEDDVPLGTLLYFGESGEVVRASAFAAKGTTSITVDAVHPALEDNDTAKVGRGGGRFIQAGTVMAEIAASGKIIPRALVAAASLSAFDASVAADGGNTGNGVLTLANPKTGTGVKAGDYVVTIIGKAANAGTFRVEDPLGAEVDTGTVAVAFADEVNFTLADGATDFEIGDRFVITVTEVPAYTTIGILETDAGDKRAEDSLSGYGVIVGGVIYENMLPEATGSPKRLSATYRNELQTAGMGTGWSWQQYSDNTA